MDTNKTHIGDGVYIERDKFDPTMIRLSCARSEGNHNDSEHYIYLESFVFHAMIGWYNQYIASDDGIK